MRALIHFQIIHSSSDMGSLASAAAHARNEESAHNYIDAVQHFWVMVAATINGLRLDYANVKLYQDGLPVCGKELEIVAEVAESGSQNYKLLQALIEKGATLMGTESSELLLQEHALMLRLFASGERTAADLETAQLLLRKRDDFIAQRIDETLREEEMAILFLGLAHDIETRLPKDIVLIQPLGKPTV